jgi:hypothetical protein
MYNFVCILNLYNVIFETAIANAKNTINSIEQIRQN